MTVLATLNYQTLTLHAFMENSEVDKAIDFADRL